MHVYFDRYFALYTIRITELNQVEHELHHETIKLKYDTELSVIFNYAQK